MTVDLTAFLIRTNENTRQVQGLINGLKNTISANVFVVCDESNGVTDFPGTQKLSLSTDVIAKWDFKRHPEDWGWFCGDYCYYAAAEALPDFQFYCLIESDVFLNDDGFAAIKGILQENTKSAIAADLRRFDQPPKYSNDLAEIGEDPHFGCIFPFTRVSKALISDMFQLRSRVQNHHSSLRINDEAILATAAHKSGAGLTDLYTYQNSFNKNCFATNPPFLQEALECEGGDIRVFHPTVPLAKVLDRIQNGEKNYSKHRLRGILRDSPKQVRLALSRALERAASTPAEPRSSQKEPFETLERLACLINLLESYEPIDIVDVGANPIEGSPSYANLLGHGQAQLIGFEPNEEAFEELTKNDTSNERYYCRAIGRGGEDTLYLTQHSGFSSLFRPDEASAEYLGFKRATRISSVEEIATSRLDDLDFIPPIDYLKIGVQGGGLDVIRNASEKLSTALVVQSAVRFFPLYENEPTFGELERELREQGFFFHSFDFLKQVLGSPYLRKKFRRRAFSQVIDGDAFFVRDLRAMNTFTDQQLAKLCILADSVMSAYDLVGLCLEELTKRGSLSPGETEKYFALLPDRVLRPSSAPRP